MKSVGNRNRTAIIRHHEWNKHKQKQNDSEFDGGELFYFI
jgi:hypothetical protein